MMAKYATAPEDKMRACGSKAYQTGVMAGILAPEAPQIDVELYATCNYLLDTYLKNFRGRKEEYVAGFIMGYKGWCSVEVAI